MPGSDMNCADSWPCTSRWCTHELPSWSSSSQAYRGRSHHRARLCSAHTRGGKIMSSIDTVNRGFVSSMTEKMAAAGVAAVSGSRHLGGHLLGSFRRTLYAATPISSCGHARTRRSVGVTDIQNCTVVRERVASSFLSSGQGHGAILPGSARGDRPWRVARPRVRPTVPWNCLHRARSECATQDAGSRARADTCCNWVNCNWVHVRTMLMLLRRR